MRKITQTIVGTTPPLDKNVLWLDTTNSDSPVEKVFLNGEWKATSDPSIDAYTKEESDERFLENATNEGSMSQVLKIGNDNKPVWANVPGATAPDDRMSDVSENAVQNKAIKKYIDSNFARQDGWYDTLVSGAAKNLVGHGTTPAEYTFRTSGGNADIGTGTATIDVMKGKTLKWNQGIQMPSQQSESTLDDITYTFYPDGRLTISGTTSKAGSFAMFVLNIPTDHKVLIRQPDGASQSFYFCTNKEEAYSSVRAIFTCTGAVRLKSKYTSGVTVNITCYPQVFDLTEMFGAGNEPTTVAEFEALYPLDYYPYTATPVLINNAASGIVTTGFNQWDEEWEQGNYSDETGAPTPASSYIRSKNAIKVFPQTAYYKQLDVRVFYYDINNNYIGHTSSDRGIFTTPANCHFIRIRISYAAPYKNDICINLSWSGYRNGEYEPYEKHILYFNGESGSLATVTGKKIVDGSTEGQESEYVWPEGMKGFGGKFDFGKADSDSYIRVGNRVFGIVDLGDFSSWTLRSDYSTTGDCYVIVPASFNMAKGLSGKIQVACAEYPCVPNATRTSITESTAVWLEIAPTGATNSVIQIRLADKTLSSGTEVQNYLSGVKLYYELETPEEYLLDTPIPANYIVNDFGTEQRIPVDTASSVMAPVLYDVKYAMNASDQLRRMRVNFVSATGIDNSTPSTLDNLLTCLGTALNGTFTKSSYDNENENYTFTFTPNETPGE